MIPLHLQKKLNNVCQDLAHKLTDPEHVIATSLKPCNFIPYIQAHPWGATSLSHGCPGMMIFFSEMATVFPDQQWDQLCHKYLAILLDQIQKEGFRNASLFSGLTGICFAVHLAGGRYTKLLNRFHTTLLQTIETNYLQPNQNFPISPFLYDHIAGVTGVISYLLNYKTMSDTTKKLLSILIQIASPNGNLPGWYNSPKHYIRDYEHQLYPNGFFDTGIAHGVAGCLAALSKAYLCGIKLPGQEEAMQIMINWLKTMRQDIGPFQQVWPSKIGLDNVPSSSYRDGWCYGAPGISISLFLAAHSLKDSSLYDYAVQIMKTVCIRYKEQPSLQCVSFCHGLSGLLAMIYQMHLATKQELFFKTAQSIAADIVEKYDQKLPFGFKCYASTPDGPDLLIDNPGLLDGSIGAGLSLLLLLQEKQRPWMELFLLS